MPKHTGILDHDEEWGLTTLFHRLHDGEWVHEMQQSAEAIQAITDANKEAQNHCNPWAPDRWCRMDARIPIIFAQKWFDEEGIDIFSPDPHMQKRVDRKLNDPEFRWMRTSNAKL